MSAKPWFLLSPLALAVTLAQAQAQIAPAAAFAPLPQVAPAAMANAAVGEIAVEVDTQSAVANGVSRIAVKLELRDAAGQRLATPARITVEASAGRVLLAGASTDETGPGALDADPLTPGIQIDVAAGSASFWIVAPAQPQTVLLRISAGRVLAEGRIEVLPELREMLAVGLVEGVIGLRRQDRNTVQPVRIDDGFERELRAWSHRFNDGEGMAAGRAALFLKGRIKGDALLTLAYDSDKDTYQRLMRDTLPDQYYPIYGDASIKAFDAQSMSKLYVRLDQGKHYLLYGDFDTAVQWQPLVGSKLAAPLKLRDLGAYARKVTGARLHLEDVAGQANVFAVRDSLRVAIEEYAANGTSGPFAVRNSAGLIGSERVEVITRDRNNLSLIVRATPLAPLADYVFEPFSGRVLLNRPLASFDLAGNPQYLRITYEVDQGGPEFWLAGVDGQWRISPRLELGGAYIDDRNELAPYKLGSVNTGARLGANTQLVAEFARSEGRYNTSGSNGALTPGLAGVMGEAAGNAARVALDHDDGRSTARIYAGRSDREFDNPAASFNGGRGDAGARATHKLSPELMLFGEAVRSEDRIADGVRNGAQLGAAWKLGDQLSLDVAVKVMNENGKGVAPAASIPGQPSSSIGTVNSPLTPSGGFFGTGNNAVDPSTGQTLLAPQVAAPNAGAGRPLEATTVQLGAQYQLTPALSLLGEVEHSIAGDDQKRAALGASYQMAEQTRIYGRWEAQRGLASVYSLNPADQSNGFSFGAETTYAANAQFFSEYRLRDAVGDPLLARDAQLASGTRNTWMLAPGLRLVTSAEYLKILAGNSQAAVALAAGIDYTANPLWKGLARLEWRRLFDGAATPIDERQDSYLSTLTVARKLNRDWSVLARNYLLFTDFQATGDRLQDRFQLGLAYRPVDNNRWNALGKYEFKVERDQSGLPGVAVGTTVNPSQRDAHILSLLGDWHPSRPWWLTGRVAAKTVKESFDGVAVPRYSAWYLGGRTIYDITERWDVGVLAAYLGSAEGRSRQTAYGAEVAYQVQTNLRVALGSNLTGFSDRDLSGSDYTARGVYIRLRFKFDEDLFRGADPVVNRSLPRAATS
ncbi:MAG: hypothetical protein RR101_11070 [Burkholderiaceae bacterium]